MDDLKVAGGTIFNELVMGTKRRQKYRDAC